MTVLRSWAWTGPTIKETAPVCHTIEPHITENGTEQGKGGDYCFPASVGATPTTISVPPSNSISLLAPSRMLEASAILGSCSPGALFATSTPGMDVVRMAIWPVWATIVPGGGPPFAIGAAPGEPPGPCPPLLALALGLEDPAAWDPFVAEALADAAPSAGEID
jgi:hypothetical protein